MLGNSANTRHYRVIPLQFPFLIFSISAWTVCTGYVNSVKALPTCSLLWQSLPPMEGRFLIRAAWTAFLFSSSKLLPLWVSMASRPSMLRISSPRESHYLNGWVGTRFPQGHGQFLLPGIHPDSYPCSICFRNHLSTHIAGGVPDRLMSRCPRKQRSMRGR